MLKDYYTNTDYWQEYDCPCCGIDFDVSPIPKPGTVIRCSCGCKWLAGEVEANTYAGAKEDGITPIAEYPQKED